MNRLLLPSAVVLVLLLAAPASSSVRINVGIDGVKIGQTQAQVRANLGKPTRTVRGTDQVSSFTVFHYTALKMVVRFQDNTSVTNITTTGRGDRTATGVGVGSTEAEVKKGVKGVKCERVDSARRICLIFVNSSGRGTTFRLTRDKVTEVNVGVVAD